MISIKSLIAAPLLLGWQLAAASNIEARPAAAKAHDASHPFVLANETDFLTALISLYEESVGASLAAAERAQSHKIRAYATRTAARHQDEVVRLRKVKARHDKGRKSDFHFQARMPDIYTLKGIQADRYYLDGLSRLLAAKVELAEFASGTVKSSDVRKVAGRVIESQSEELVRLGQWIRSYDAAR